MRLGVNSGVNFLCIVVFVPKRLPTPTTYSDFFGKYPRSREKSEAVTLSNCATDTKIEDDSGTKDIIPLLRTIANKLSSVCKNVRTKCADKQF